MSHLTEKKEQRQKRNNDKDRKALYNLMNNAVCGKVVGNLRNRIDLKLVTNKKDNFKLTSKPN